jgi:hypothetical protein
VGTKCGIAAHCSQFAVALRGSEEKQTRLRRFRLRFMKAKSSVAMVPLLAAGLLLLATGCQTVEDYSLTYRVWDNDSWCKFSDPAANPNLALFEATNHAYVLVQYDAFSEKHSRFERHAYYLHPSQARVAAGPKPELVKPSAADGMNPIPVLPTQSALTDQPPGVPAYAVVTKMGVDSPCVGRWSLSRPLTCLFIPRPLAQRHASC